MSSDSSKSSIKRGNTKSPFDEKKKQISPAKQWCFTLNNWTQEEYSSIVPLCRETCIKWIIGKEVGEKCGTPHLQGFCYFKNKVRPKSVFNFTDRIRWEKCKGNAEQNFNYCNKSGDYISEGFPKPPTTIKRSQFYPWQEKMVKIFEVPCKWNCRTIYWRYGDVNIGKTQFCRWLCVHMGAVVIGGENKHVLAQVQNQPAPIYIILLVYGDDEINYKATEQIKDGLFSTAFGCDNNRMEVRDAPHLLIIGNEPPDTNHPNFHPGKYNVKRIKHLGV